MKISVIIPMYKVSAFIERCAESLMKQTLDDVEFLFVDDCSPDDSRAVLETVLARYPARDARVIVHENNMGLPSARNTGLALTHGEFIFHCDGDDFVEPDMLEKMYAAAVAADADYVWSDFYISFEQNERYMSARDYSTPEELIRKGYLCGDMKFNVWNKLVRRDVYEKAERALGTACLSPLGIFPSGHPMAEDMTMILLAACATKVAYVPSALYHYVRTNAGAMTQVVTQRQLDDIQYNVARTVEFLGTQCPGVFDKEINVFKLGIKLPFLLSGTPGDTQRWKQWYPESDGYAFANTELPFRTKFLMWMAAHGQWWYVWLYRNVVFKFFYGVLYR